MDKIKGELMWITDADHIEEEPERVTEVADFILNLAPWCDHDIAHENSYAHISLDDGPGTDYKEFKIAVDILLDRIQDDDMCVVNCSAGISRSVTVVTTAVAFRRKQSFEEALGRVRSSHPTPCRPAPELVELAEKYLEEIR